MLKTTAILWLAQAIPVAKSLSPATPRADTTTNGKMTGCVTYPNVVLNLRSGVGDGGDGPPRLDSASRRHWIFRSAVASFAALVSDAGPGSASDELPDFLRRSSSAFVPLLESSGKAPPNIDRATKSAGLPLADIASILQKSLESSAAATGSAADGKGYFVTGGVPSFIFRDDCIFVDPTNSVTGLKKYMRALRLLFDPDDHRTFVEIVTPLAVDGRKRTISGRIRSGGVLALPWRPVVRPYESDITFFVDADGLVAEQRQKWSVGAVEALLEALTPGDGRRVPPPPPVPAEEPPSVTALFDAVYSRKPGAYRPEEAARVDVLVDRIIQSGYPSADGLLTGRWDLCYLRPGPDGKGIDRRLPFFPENLPFNDNYQIFAYDGKNGDVTNVGEIAGPLLSVRVSGTLARLSDDGKSPARFRADIDGGGLCFGSDREKSAQKCIPLPIRGEGLFDGIYVGERLRIGRNINGGGAIAVQIRGK